MWSRPYWPLLLALLLAACSGGRNASVGEGFLQKRRHQAGWHFDLGLRRMHAVPERAARKNGLPVTALASEELPAHEGMEPLAEARLPDERTPTDLRGSVMQQPAPPIAMPRTTAPRIASSAPVGDRDPENIMPRGRFNAWSIPSLLLVLGAIALAFLTNNGLLVSGLLLLGLVMAGFSLARIRSREQRGKVYALVALVLGSVAALITAMVVVRSGF